MKKRWLWLLILAPLALGVLIALPPLAGWTANPLLYFEGDLAAYALAIGGFLSTLLAFLAWRQRQYDRRNLQVISNLRLQEAQHRGQFLLRLDHEIKNPFAIIRTDVASLKETALSPEQRELVKRIDAQVMRASDVTTEIRRILDMRVRELGRTQIDLVHLAEDVVAFAVSEGPTVHPFLQGGRQPTVQRYRGGPLPYVWADEDLLQVAVYNLVQNACKFTSPTGRIELQAGVQGPWVTLSVVDSGCGIPADELPRLGEELFRGQNARDLPGKGLGLAMAQAIVERHDGALTVQSWEGRGTAVTIRLPREQTA